MSQYIRKCSIMIEGVSSTFEAGDLKCRFQIQRGDSQTPNTADVRIYNLNSNTITAIMQEFTRITISAGYVNGGNYGLLFTGTIKQTRFGREDGKDSYVDITAADGDKFYNFAPIADNIASGNAAKVFLQLIQRRLSSLGATTGYAPNFEQNKSIRGKVFYGMGKDAARKFAQAQGCTWSVQDGAVTFVPLNSFIPAGYVPVISPQTGLIGAPEQTQQGIKMLTLLNSSYKIGQLVKLQDATVNLLRLGLSASNTDQGPRITGPKSFKTNPDGLYYVLNANHYGDTRGNEWYSDLTCLAIDATLPPSGAYDSLVNPDDKFIQGIPQL